MRTRDNKQNNRRQLTVEHGDLYWGRVEVIKGEEFARQSNDWVADTKPSLKGVVKSNQSELVNEWISQPQELSQFASQREREEARSPGENERSLWQSPIVSCYKKVKLSL
jgi:hypothetical protein